MQFAYTEEQQLIASSAETFFRTHGASERVRRAIASAAGFDEDAWREIAAMGWMGMALPESYGGAGLGYVELTLLLERMGRCIYPSPFFPTVCLAAPAILLSGSQAQRQELLPALASGEKRATLASCDERAIPGVDGVVPVLERHAGQWRLNGRSCFVIYGHVADLFIVAARARGSSGSTGVSLLALPASTAGISIEKLVMMDQTRPMSRVTFSNVTVAREQILGEPESAGSVYEAILQRGAIALAAEQTGGAQAALDITTEYVKQRVQFDRPIGSFQAVKHRLADMLVKVEAARSAMCYAACVVDENCAELPEAAAIAKACCSDAFIDCAGEMIQLHGGIGFTWEHDAHLYFKRARASATLLGTPQYHRATLARLMGLDGPVGAAS